LAGSLFASAQSFAEVGPYGPMFPANGIDLPPSSWATSCHDSRGVTITLLERCGAEYCNETAHLVIERRGEDGARLGERFRVTEARAVAGYGAVSCAADGAFAVSWMDDATRCFLVRIYDENGVALSGAFHFGGDDACPFSDRPTLLIYPDRGVLALWHIRPLDERNDLVARRFTFDGRPIGPAVVMNDPVRGWVGAPGAALDDSGVVPWHGRTKSTMTMRYSAACSMRWGGR